MLILYKTQIVLIICYILSLFLFIKNPLKNQWGSSNKVILICIGIFLIVAAVTRPEETADTDNYIYGFTRGVVSGRMEPMFSLIVTISRLFSDPVVVGFSIFAGLSIIARLYNIKKYSVNIYASIMIYLSYCYIAQDIVAIRSGVASALLLVAVDYKFQEKYKYMFFVICIATLFHYTALIFVILFFINTEKKQRLIYLSLLIGCYLLYYIDFDIRVFFPYLQYLTFFEYNLSSYSNSTEVVFGTLNGPQILRITTCLFFWIFIDRIFRKNMYSLMYLKIFTISLCMYPLFSSINTMGGRMYEIFSSAEAISLPICFAGVFDKPFLGKIAIIIYASYFFFVSINSFAYWAPHLF